MPNYVLTCPQCKHTLRVRFIRKGATATCTLCQHQYRVEGSVLAVESGGHATEPAAEDKPFELLRDRITAAGEEAEAAVAFEPSPESTLAAAEGPPAVPFTIAVAPPPAGSASRAARRAALRQRRSSRGKLVALAAFSAMLLLAILVGLIASRPGGGASTATPTTPVTDPNGSVAVTPDPGATTAPPGPTTTEPADADRPVLLLSAAAADAAWSAFAAPIRPVPQGEVSASAQWTVGMLNGAGASPALLGLFVDSDGPVYRSARLRLQLLGEDRLAFAELSTEVPVVCAAQGVQMVLPVPSDYAARTRSIVSRFETGEPVRGGLALELAEASVEPPIKGATGSTLRCTVRNPHAEPVRDPVFVVERCDPSGRVLERWTGTLGSSIEPGAELEFDAPLQTDLAEASLRIRSFAMRFRRAAS